MSDGPRVVDSFDVSSWDDPPGRRSVLEVLDDGTTRTVLVHDEIAPSIIADMQAAMARLEANPAMPSSAPDPGSFGIGALDINCRCAVAPVLILTPEQRADVERMQAEHARLREIEDRARAAPCRAARWHLSTWAACDRCGEQTRAVYLDGKHRHMICEARR